MPSAAAGAEFDAQRPFNELPNLPSTPEQVESLAKRVTASKYLSELEELGMLYSIQIQRDKYFINHRLLDLLSEANRQI